MLDGVRCQRKKVGADGNDMRKKATAGVVVIVVLGAVLAAVAALYWRRYHQVSSSPADRTGLDR